MTSIIKNSDALAVTDARKDALAIAEAGYSAIDIADTIGRKMRVCEDSLEINGVAYPLTGRRVFFLGIGKCAIRGGTLIEKMLGGNLTSGIMFDVARPEHDGGSKMETLIGTHPLPSAINVAASARILQFLSGRDEQDLVIMLISGGGSALLSLPPDPMTVEDEVELFKHLTSLAAPIQDINVVRKHISRVRGGALAVAAYPAQVVSLLVSDVPGDDIEFIASGPTIRDVTTVRDAEDVLATYNVTPPKQTTFLETAKESKYFENVTNTLLLSNLDALEHMTQEATTRGYGVQVVDTHFAGEARDIGRAVVEKLHQCPPKTALLYAGESTVTLNTTTGHGGRNQEMALSTLDTIADDELVLPFASDGHDFTEHAGAISDALTRAHAEEKNVSVGEHLETHRSHNFFEVTGDAIVTGYTGSNVSDLIIALKS